MGKVLYEEKPGSPNERLDRSHEEEVLWEEGKGLKPDRRAGSILDNLVRFVWKLAQMHPRSRVKGPKG